MSTWSFKWDKKNLVLPFRRCLERLLPLIQSPESFSVSSLTLFSTFTLHQWDLLKTHTWSCNAHLNTSVAFFKIQLRLSLPQEAVFDPMTPVTSHSLLQFTCVHVFSILDSGLSKGSFPVLCPWHLSQHLILSWCFLRNPIYKAVLISLAKALG